MRHYRVSFASALLLGISSVALSGCAREDMPGWYKDITNTHRPAQVVAGGKRPPVLNPKAGEAMTPPPPLPPQASAAPPPQPAFEEDPYEYFNASPPAPAARASGRKQFPGNPPASPAYIVSDPLPPEVMQDIPPPLPATPVPPPSPVAEAPAETPEPAFSLPGFLGGGDAAAASSAPADGELSYPPLSSVPYKPPQLREVKAGKQEHLEELQQEHMWAEQQRQALESGELPGDPAPPTVAGPMPLMPTAQRQQEMPAASIESPRVWNEEPEPAPAAEASGLPWDGAAAPQAAPAGEDAPPPGSYEAYMDTVADLPPTGVLREIPVLPPSRYHDRLRALKQPPAAGN